MNKIGVIGLGFVGNAVAKGLCHAFDVYGYDKKSGKWFYDRNSSSASRWIDFGDGPTEPLELLLLSVDGPIFVCVPTPMRPDGSCDVSIVEQVLGDLSRIMKVNGCSGQVVVIKSTVVPGTSERMGRLFPNLHVCFNPEFLTERNAVEDFKNQDRIIIGGPHEGTAALKQVYETAYPGVPVTKTSATIAELVKYTTNCFLATKVAFANELKQVCDGLGADYDKVVEYATKDKRLGNSHWSVPGPDGHKGFGLTCFPKDLNAMIHLAGDLGVDPKVMSAAWGKNLEVRPERDWEAMKGRAVSEPVPADADPVIIDSCES